MGCVVPERCRYGAGQAAGRSGCGTVAASISAVKDTRPRRAAGFWAVWVGLALLAASGCEGDKRPPAAARPHATAPARPNLRLVALTDVSGYLEPCGCQSRPLGGVDKGAQVLRELSADGVPSVVLTAGDLFFEAPHGGHGASDDAEAKTEHIWRAETLADALKQLGLAASEPGVADARYGAETLAALDARAGGPLLSPERPTRVIERGGVKLGVFGLSEADGVDLIALAKQHTAALRSSGAQVVVGLLRADARAARRVAGGVPGLDFVLLGGTHSASVPPPARIGEATLLQAAKHGHGLLVVELWRKGEGSFADTSAWTRAQASAAQAARVSELEQRIAAWKRDAKTDPALLKEQEQRLAALKQEQLKTGEAAQVAGNSFSARFIELGPEIKGDAALRAVMDAYDKRINEHNRVALAGRKPIPVPAGAPSYVGSAKCASCHEEAHAWWQGHAHGHAYATLVERNKQFNLSCVGCHVVGYGKPGGATVTHNEGLVDVGCESCHGPASMHVEDADADEAVNVKRAVPEALCVECHQPEHSDKFVYDEYRAKLIVPGHGLPKKSGAN